MIPKIIHYVWVGPNPLPEEDAARIAQWRALLPDWEIRGWGNADIDMSSAFARQAFSVEAWNRISDYTRMQALVEVGGIYLDADVDVVRPLDELRSLDAFVGFQLEDDHSSQLVNGAIFGAAKGHWFPTALRSYFDTKLDGRNDIGAFSGPGLITKLLREKGLARYSDSPVNIDGVTIFPRRFFYPYSWKESYSPDVIVPDTYAVHRWAETWVPRRSLKKRIRKKLIKTLAQRFPALALHRAKRRVGLK